MQSDQAIDDFKNIGMDNKCCLTPHYIEDRGLHVCTSCGMTSSKQVYSNKYLATFNYDDIEKRRINEPVSNSYGFRTLLHDIKDYKGVKLDPSANYLFKRLKRLQSSLGEAYSPVVYKVQNLKNANPLFSRLKDFRLPRHVIKEGRRIYEVAIEQKITKGLRSIASVVAGSIYCAIKQYNIPKTLNELARFFQITKRAIYIAYSLLHQRILPNLSSKIEDNPKKPENFAIRYSNELNLPMDCQKSALEIIKIARKKGYRTSGKDPKAIGGAVLLLSLKMYNQNIEDQQQIKFSQKRMVEIVESTPVTLRKRQREIEKLINRPNRSPSNDAGNQKPEILKSQTNRFTIMRELSIGIRRDFQAYAKIRYRDEINALLKLRTYINDLHKKISNKNPLEKKVSKIIKQKFILFKQPENIAPKVSNALEQVLELPPPVSTKNIRKDINDPFWCCNVEFCYV